MDQFQYIDKQDTKQCKQFQGISFLWKKKNPDDSVFNDGFFLGKYVQLNNDYEEGLFYYSGTCLPKLIFGLKCYSIGNLCEFGEYQYMGRLDGQGLRMIQDGRIKFGIFKNGQLIEKQN